jgi:hypothetical protein
LEQENHQQLRHAEWQKEQTVVSQSSQSASVSALVRQLMRRHGVEERQFSKKLAEVLQLSYSQAHRKMGGGVDWTFGQMAKVAEYFGETIEAFGVGFNRPGAFIQPSATPGGEEGVFVVGDHKLDCLVTIGEQIFSSRGTRFIAVRSGAAWHVLEANDFPVGRPAYRVAHLEICVGRKTPASIAVLDSDRGEANRIRDYLNGHGFVATALFNQGTLGALLPDRIFEGFVLAWEVGGDTCEALLRQVRNVCGPSAPVMLLTGAACRNQTEDSALAKVVKLFDVVCHEKPARLKLLAAVLATYFQ